MKGQSSCSNCSVGQVKLLIEGTGLPEGGE